MNKIHAVATQNTIELGKTMKNRLLFGAAAAAIAIASMGSAKAITFAYQGLPFDTGNTGAIPGPISGTISFWDTAFLPGTTMTEADVNDFSFSAEINSVPVNWTFSGASWFDAEFVVNAGGTGFDAWGFFAEQELVGGNSNIESVLIDNNSSLGGRVRDAVTTGDDHPNQVSTHTSELGSSVASAGQFSAVPVPAAGVLMFGGLAFAGVITRSRRTH